jgi:hypothetical protein
MEANMEANIERVALEIMGLSPDFFLNFSNSPKIPEKKFRPFTAATQ